MALAFSEKFRGNLDRKRLVITEVTHDGSATAITAANLGMNYIDFAMNVQLTVPLSATSAAYADLTTNEGTSLAMTALSSGAITAVLAIGT